MRAIVLAGGRGRRLAPLTTVFPKPLAPIGDVPIIDIVLRQLRWHGIRQVIISVGYLGELIQAYFATRGGIEGLEITYVREDTPLGTAGPLALLDDLEQDLLVVNGDVLSDFAYSDLLAFHREHQPALSIAVNHREVQIDLGVVDFGQDGVVTGFREKPRIEYHCSMGINLYSPRALQAITRGEPLDFPDLALRLVERGETVMAYTTDCYWMDIGRRDDYDRAIEEFPALRARLLPDEGGAAPAGA
ncbi:MAG: sugar phosphate nucleotidyltransferase [Thermomicrobiales bacterium]